MRNFILIILSVFFSSGCKVNYSFTGASVNEKAKTVSVAYFQNNASLAPPILAQQLTNNLRDVLLTQTSLKATTKNGDLTYSGIINEYRVDIQAPLANQTNSINRLTISIFVKFENKFDEKQNFEQSFSRYADFTAEKTLLQVQDQLIKEINDQLSQDIFNKSLTNW